MRFSTREDAGTAVAETMFNLAADGKTSKKGMPGPLRLAVIASHHFAGEIALA